MGQRWPAATYRDEYACTAHGDANSNERPVNEHANAHADSRAAYCNTDRGSANSHSDGNASFV